jgi:hypothetical protein
MTLASSWLEVDDQSSADRLLDSTIGFHDSVAREARWVGAEFVNPKGNLELHGYGELHLLIDSQFENVSSIELRFHSVKRFAYDYEWDAEALIRLDSEGISTRLGAWEVVAEKLEYRLIPAI